VALGKTCKTTGMVHGSDIKNYFNSSKETNSSSSDKDFFYLCTCKFRTSGCVWHPLPAKRLFFGGGGGGWKRVWCFIYFPPFFSLLSFLFFFASSPHEANHSVFACQLTGNTHRITSALVSPLQTSVCRLLDKRRCPFLYLQNATSTSAPLPSPPRPPLCGVWLESTL